jgi:hypothetical protein
MARSLTYVLIYGLISFGILLMVLIFLDYSSFLKINGETESGVVYFTKDRFEAFQFRSLTAGVILLVFSVYVLMKKNVFLYLQDTFSYNFKEIKSSFSRMKTDFWKVDAKLQFLFFIILITGMFLRVRLALEPITYDEAFTYTQYASKSFPQILADYSYPNNHIFFTLFAKISTSIFGVSEFALRLPALIASFLLLFFGFFLAQRLKSKYGAVIFLFFIAFVPALVEYGSYARGYSFLALFTLLIVYSLDRWIKTGQCYQYTRMNIYLILGIWTVPIFSFLLIPISLVLYFEFRKKALLPSLWLKVISLTLLLYLPAILLYGVSCLWNPPLYALGDITHFTLNETFEFFYKDFIYLAPLFLWLMVSGVLFLSLDYKQTTHQLLIFSILLMAVIVIIKPDLLLYRIWIYLLIPFYWVLADGIRWERFSKYVFMSLILIAGIIFSIRQEYYKGRVERFYGLENELIEWSEKNKNKVHAPFPMDAPAEFYAKKANLNLVFTDFNSAEIRLSYDFEKYNPE